MVATTTKANGELSALHQRMIESAGGEQDIVISSYDISRTDKGVRQVFKPQLYFSTRNSKCFAEIQLYISEDAQEYIFVQFHDGSIYRYSGDLMKEKFSQIVAADLLKPIVVDFNTKLPFKLEVPSAGSLYNSLLKHNPEVTSIKWFEKSTNKVKEQPQLQV